MIYHIKAEDLSIICPAKDALAWVDFMLDKGYAPTVKLASPETSFR